MKPFKKQVEEASKQHDIDCFRNEPWTEPTLKRSFDAGASFAARLIVEMLKSDKAPRTTSLDNPCYYLTSEDVSNWLQKEIEREL